MTAAPGEQDPGPAPPGGHGAAPGGAGRPALAAGGGPAAEVWGTLMIGSALALRPGGGVHPAGTRLGCRNGPIQLNPVHQRQRTGARQDDERAVLTNRIRRSTQVPHQLVGRGHDMHRGTAPGPA